ncbi:MAG TPA: M20/M25/M40 family metallo-hydrolase [Solirubrobacteraceae bacterium]|nr:M20/M25/M40 family metallo-hydrolase [Solirubrobacteraceae bacterium]
MTEVERESMTSNLERETTSVLQRLVRFNTVNPPGNERPALEYVASYVGAAGFETELLGAEEQRPNLIATLPGAADGPTLGLLGHIDTVLADAAEWTHDPWSGDVADGFLWGRGAIDMKSQVAAEAVGAVALASSGWRPARGQLRLMFVSDEETGGGLGARWLSEQHPDKVRCDMLINEGAGEVFEYGGRRLYGVCCGEKGLFRFRLTARGVAGHASLPRMGDNALLKLAPVLAKFGEAGMAYDVGAVPAALLKGLAQDPNDPAGAVARIAQTDPALAALTEPLLGVTLSPTMAHASDKINVIPSRAEVKVDCRVPPGLTQDRVQQRIAEALGTTLESVELDFIDVIPGNESTVESPLMDAISRWVQDNDAGAGTVPVVLAGGSDSRWFRAAFPDCVAYGFFPQRHMDLLQTSPLVHSADERIDVRDLGFAARFYHDIARELLG